MEKLLTADQAIQFAKTAADDFKESRLKISLDAAEAKSPTLVQRIDRKDAYYFIVPFWIGPRETARFIVDGFVGKLKEASGISAPAQSLQSYVSPQDALDRVLTARSTSKMKWDVEFRREHIGVHPVLVWQPCRQSPSPFLPFFQFSVAGSLVYLRADGQLFSRLDTPPPKPSRRGGARGVSRSHPAHRPRR